MNRFHHILPEAAGCRRTRMGVLTLVFIGAVAVLAATGASASGVLPVSPTYLDATTAYNGLQVEPSRITYTGDGTGFLGGAKARDESSSIRWTKWTTHIALGSGFNQLDNCNPSCAGGTFRGYRVRIELWRPRTLAGTLVFTRMTIWYKKHPPRGEPRHYTFTDTHRGGVGGGYGWGPPDQQGYCVHTYGLPPAPGCRNIHSLP